MRVVRLAAGLLLSLALLAAPAQAGLKLVPAYSDSQADPVATHSPIYLTAPPGDSTQLFVVERGGRIRVAVNGQIQDTPFLDIASRVDSDPTSEAGLLSMAFAPDYATSRKFYVDFVNKADGDIHVEEYTRSLADPDVADPAPTRTVLDIAHPGTKNHYGAQITFGPDGKLYAGTGDGGGAYDPNDNAQNPASQLGKLLAIDTSVDPATVTTVAMGLRNPYRFSFDTATGDLVIGDVGQATWEEVDWVPVTDTLLGSNFGWDCYEGTAHLKPACDPASYVPPVLEYPNPNGDAAPHTAITGGVVVRDPALTTLFGRYLYADVFAGVVHSAVLAKPVTDDRQEDDLGTVSMPVAFGEDADGHVYVVSLTGAVRQIVCEGPCDSPNVDTTPAPASDSGSSQPPGGTGTEAPAQPEAQPQPAPVARDTTAPKLRLRAARVQDPLRRHVVRLSIACDEACTVRAGGRAGASALKLRGVLERLTAGKRVVVELPASARVRRALARGGSVLVDVRARDAAGNVRTASLTVRVRRR